jgi:hypothetical protein
MQGERGMRARSEELRRKENEKKVDRGAGKGEVFGGGGGGLLHAHAAWGEASRMSVKMGKINKFRMTRRVAGAGAVAL